MPAVPLCPTVACDTYNPASAKCSACDPSDHQRVWIPDGPTARTLVLCFDGTGDSFDEDVSQPSSPSYLRSGSCPRLTRMWRSQNSNVVQFLAMLKKDNPENQLVYYQVIHSLSTRKSAVLMCLSSGRYRDLHKQCPQVAHHRDDVQDIGRDGRLRPSRPHKRSLLPSSRSASHHT